MDRELEALKRQCAADPENTSLRRRLASATQRLAEREIDKALDVLASFLRALAKVLLDAGEFQLQKHELDIQKHEPGMVLRVWQDYSGLSIPQTVTDKIVARLQRESDPAPQSTPRTGPLNTGPQSIWSVSQDFFDALLAIIVRIHDGSFEHSPSDFESLTYTLMNAVSTIVTHAFESSDYGWIYTLETPPPLTLGQSEAALLETQLRAHYNSERVHHPWFGRTPRDPAGYLSILDTSLLQGDLIAKQPAPLSGFWPIAEGNAVSWGGSRCDFSVALERLLEWAHQQPIEVYPSNAQVDVVHFHLDFIKAGDSRYYLITLYD